MNVKTNIDVSKEHVTLADTEFSGIKRFRRLLYWLAGARWATLAHVPASERERIAVLGSSVIIPTLLAFFGMYLYVSSRFHDPHPIISVSIAFAWALIIMNVDRILLTTYRPFQPWFRKAVQVGFRIGLAGVVSVAITFPFCLHQYRGAIAERLQHEFRGLMEDVQVKERAERAVFESVDVRTVNDLRTKLAHEQSDGPADPQLYAEILATQDSHRQVDIERTRTEGREQEANVALEKWKDASTRILAIEQRLHMEERGTLSPELGGTGKPGRAAKFNELRRDLELTQQVEQVARQRYHQLLKIAVAEPESPAINDGALPPLEASKQAAYVREAALRNARIEALAQAVKQAEVNQANHLADLNLRYTPVIKNYQSKINGSFDPMEETIGLFKVIFASESERREADNKINQYKWIAALFQFGIVFGTLFLLDLIAILSKVMSRPGPYDVLVEFPEFVSSQNLLAFKKEYQRTADAWVEAAASPFSNGPSNNIGIDLRNPEMVADLLLVAQLTIPMHTDAKRQEQ
ncbi:MAG: DUF4407 domain-containing protein [Desulfobulbaceae bacterium]|nr:DUF4407 domain-containing protein [Desulfobulbaceae bacterium]